jgi:serine/threonine-protein kinase
MGGDPTPKSRTDRPIEEPPAPVAPLPPPEVEAVAPVAEPLEPEKTPPPIATPLASVEVITTPPGASVVLDGIPLLGVTPLHVDDIEPGDHAIIVSLPGYKEETRLLTLDKTTTWKLEIALAPLKTRTVAQKRVKPQPTQARARPATGYLTVNTVPWSDVFVGGRKLGQAPLAEKEVPAGTYRIVFKNPVFGRRERKVTIRPGDTTKLNLDFRDQQK